MELGRSFLGRASTASFFRDSKKDEFVLSGIEGFQSLTQTRTNKK